MLQIKNNIAKIQPGQLCLLGKGKTKQPILILGCDFHGNIMYCRLVTKDKLYQGIEPNDFDLPSEPELSVINYPELSQNLLVEIYGIKRINVKTTKLFGFADKTHTYYLLESDLENIKSILDKVFEILGKIASKNINKNIKYNYQ